MKHFDFIIGYENKVREIESACLIKYELERRGYSVMIFQEFDQRYDDVHEIMYHAKVLILSCGYNDSFLETFIKRFISFDRLVNWQWEQVRTKTVEDDPNAFLGVNGKYMRQGVQLSWGPRNYKRLTEIIGIDSSRIYVVGNVSMDFSRPDFGPFYDSRESIFNKYGIPLDKKVAMLIGSFPLAFFSHEELVEKEKETGQELIHTAQISRRRFEIEMEWILRALRENPNLFFIYRPHPGQEYDRCPDDVKHLLDDIEGETGRFITLQELSIKQWISVVDNLYSGYSTSTADTFFAHKSCYLLSPAEVPEDNYGCYYFDDCKTIGSYENFVSSLSRNEFFSPISDEMMEGYFSPSDEFSYMRTCDALVDILGRDDLIIDTSELRRKISEESDKELASKSFFKRLKLKLWKYDAFYNMYWALMKLPVKAGYFRRQREYLNRINTYRKSYISSREEIDAIMDKISLCRGREV